MESLEENEDVIELCSDGTFDLSSAQDTRQLETAGSNLKLDEAPPPPRNEKGQAPQAGPSGASKTPDKWEEYKNSGNEAFLASDFDGAMVFYTKALRDAKVEGMDKAKILSNRALCALRQTLPASASSLPSSFTVRDISRNKAHTSVTKQLLMQAVSDCSGALSELRLSKSLDTSSNASQSQLLKTLHRKALGHAMLGDHSKSLQTSSESESLLSPSTPLSLSQSIKDLLASLKQVGKDFDALSVAIEATAALVMKDTNINPSRACIAASIACCQAGGSMDAMFGVAAATAWNIVLDVHDTGDVDEDNLENVHKALSELCESVAKAVHYHKGGTKNAATCVFDVLSGRTVCESVRLAKGAGMVPVALRKEALRGAGVTAAMLMSLR